MTIERHDYFYGELRSSTALPDPVKQFDRWITEALDKAVNEPNAMNLATVSADGKPRARIVLLKGWLAGGFDFFTHYESHKGAEVQKNPWAALTFFWPELERQVRIEGKVTLLPEQFSDDYFNKRPREAQLGAWSSQQSSTLAGRGELTDTLAEMTERFADKPVPRPPSWGGYRVIPSYFEFWQGRPSRLNDRLAYNKYKSDLSDEQWQISRLSP